ncbi:LacI family DNA-binding transcriptional regulator [Streptomyces zingiberis]|uniref:Substrate-binding domain-containing protein n=1 Tax=Streptomyces zingiberis TaxID=2053010 RepID=A0ABX1BUV4_9ACTN|nr:LacI family DNA-binding transcriptional regulator [Streptomyces zingiberis]NJP99033.1 substrate-binding domain-containing protein [Streptomyces zingiberis]
MPRKRVTLADVARRAGLSTTAASMILNGRPDTRLSEDAHERVHAAAAELGYRPNVAARGLRTDKTLTIGFVSDAVATTRFAGGLIQGALDAAQQAGHVVLVTETGGDTRRETEAIAALLDRQVDGIIFATVRARELYVPDLPEGTDAVMLNATNARHPTAVLPDEATGGRAAVELLVAAGHAEGIALIGQSDEAERGLFRSSTVARRVEGIRRAMAGHGLEFLAEESIWDWEPQHGYRTTLALLRRRPDVRALLCLNDRLAFGAYQALAELRLDIPGDVSVVSFDNDEVAAYLRPGLTTVALPHEAMGRRAVELLLGRAEPAEVLLPMPVITRESVGPPRGR